MVKVSLKILESNKKIQDEILRLIVGKVNKASASCIKELSKELMQEMRGWLQDSPVILSLLGSGTLNAEVGLPTSQGDTAAASIIDAVVGSVEVEFKPFSKKMVGGLIVGIQPEDFRNILGLGSATITTAKGQKLDWLEWLLTAGSKIIVKDYELTYGNYGKRSRSGMGAIMVRKEGSGYWKMPAQYAGTPENNFITRAFEGKDSIVSSIIQKAFKSKI